MKRREAVAAVVAGAMIVLGLMALFAVELSNDQSTSRSAIESQAHQRATLVSGLIDAAVAASGQPGGRVLAVYGARHVSDRVLQSNRGPNDYVVLLDANGRVLAHSDGFTAQAAASLAGHDAVAKVQRGESWALGNVSPYREHGVIDLATRLATRSGVRILVDGVALRSLTAFTTAELSRVPGLQGRHQLLVDGNGIVIGSTNPKRPPGYAFHTPAQLHVLSHGAGVVTDRYFDQVPLANSHWKIILSVPQAEFFASLGGTRHWVPWLIFAAFSLLGIVAAILACRALKDSQRVHDTNLRLSNVNRDLAQASMSLEDAYDALAVSSQALEQRAGELARSNAELEHFASVASHDLQEPLRKVRTFTERVSDTEAERLSDTGADYLRRANAAAERMQTLIEDLLRYSRVATQGWPFSLVDMSQVTAEVLVDLEDQVSRAEAIIRIGELPVISADPSQMRQLMQNLLSNAIKFRRDDVTLEVVVAATVDRGLMTLVVRDNGIGFDPKYGRRIFRVFERLHGRGTYDGTGIGLALCLKIAARHGGAVEADGLPGAGSTFTVTLQTELTEAVNSALPPGEAEFALRTEEESLVAT
jgi:signal transduction histidine kinase